MKTILENVSLKGRNSFGVEARAARVIEYDDPGDLDGIFSHDLAGDGQWMVLSGGNNILFTQDYPGTLLHPVHKGIEIVKQDDDRVTVRAQAGEEWDDVVVWAVENGMWGIENLSRIPGYAGAAPVQNIGAYGAQLDAAVGSVEVFMTRTREHRSFTAQECGFGYRDSVFKNSLKGKAIITALNLCLSRTAAPNVRYGDLFTKVRMKGGTSLKNIREAVIEIREQKLPDPAERGNAGSFFKNPVVDDHRLPRLRELFPDLPVYPSDKKGFSKLSAAWLIEHAGWKGFQSGNVGVHDAQALIIVNNGGACGEDVVRLARLIRSDVASRFAIKLDAEVNII
jgi:UDP-N-acetylmuramate dehydrogenase